MREIGPWLVRAGVLWLVLEAVWETWAQDRAQIKVPRWTSWSGLGAIVLGLIL